MKSFQQSIAMGHMSS